MKFFRDEEPRVEEHYAFLHAQVLARVDSPAVIRFHAIELQPHPDDSGDQRQRMAIVMEYFDGVPLSRHTVPIAVEAAMRATRPNRSLPSGLDRPLEGVAALDGQ